MATANVDESPSLLLERNIAYFKDTLPQIQCHNFNWEYQKVPRVVANMLTEELDLHSRFELHENLRKFIDVGFE